MVAMTVGGRKINLEMAEVVHKMRGVAPESIREHLVEIGHTVYPPKQVLAVVTGFERQSFTTMEAQRVLTRLGFICRRAGSMPDGTPAWVRETAAPEEKESDPARRLTAVESSVAVANQAIAALIKRVEVLEAAAIQ